MIEIIINIVLGLHFIFMFLYLCSILFSKPGYMHHKPMTKDEKDKKK